MIVGVATELDAPAGEVWALMKRKQTLLYVPRRPLGMPEAREWP